MGWQYTPLTPLLLCSALVSLGLAVFLLLFVDRQGRETVVLGLVGLCIGQLWWSVTYALQLSMTSMNGMIVWEKLEVVGGLLSITSWFVFTFSYTDRDEWITPRTVGAVAAVQAVAVILALTNQFHNLIWTDPELVTSGSFLILSYTRQPLSYIHFLLTYVVILSGVYVLIRFVISSQSLYRGQAGTIVFAATFPLLIHIRRILDIGPWTSVTLSPVAYTVSGAAFVVAITRYRLLDLEPIARRRVVKNMRDGYIVLDEKERVVDLNPAAASLLDIDHDDAIGRSVAELHPELLPLVTDSEKTSQVEFVLENTGHQYVQARLSTLDEQDERRGQLMLLQDITERRGVEKRYQALIENASDVMFVLDVDGTITYASPSIERVLGMSPDSLTGTKATEYIHPEDRSMFSATLTDCVDNPGDTWRFEYRIEDVNGEWRVHEGIGQNLLENPFVKGIVINSRDITRRKDRERELERQNERLEQFAGVVSHDLRNPLEVARGRLELAKQTGDEKSFQAVEQAHDRMEAIIEDVLTLTRQGQAVTETEPLDLETVATAAWETVETNDSRLAIDASIRLTADRQRLARLLENLFRNAIEHGTTQSDGNTSNDTTDHRATNTDTTEHDQHVTVRIGRCPGGFYVADDGPGLPDIDDEELFDFGYTTADDGTGLGLAIVKQIANAHGWEISTGERSADGARFDITGVVEAKEAKHDVV